MIGRVAGTVPTVKADVVCLSLGPQVLIVGSIDVCALPNLKRCGELIVDLEARGMRDSLLPSSWTAFGVTLVRKQTPDKKS